MGYSQAGYEMVGVDHVPQPRYPFQFIRSDALEYLATVKPGEFDLIHASPPCQAYSKTRRLQGNEHPDLVGEVRAALERIGGAWVIENVPGSPLRSPVTLCGTMFGLKVYRHREFECSQMLLAPPCPGHFEKCAKMGRPAGEGQFLHVVGHFSDVQAARRAMEIDWMSRDELAQAIPPAYTRWVGEQINEQATQREVHSLWEAVQARLGYRAV